MTQRAEELDLALVFLEENATLHLSTPVILWYDVLFVAHWDGASPSSYLERAIVNVGIDGSELHSHKLVRHVGPASPDLAVRALEQKKRGKDEKDAA